MPLTPALCMMRILELIDKRKSVLQSAKPKEEQVKIAIRNELEFNTQIREAFWQLIHGVYVLPSEFSYRSTLGFSGDYISKLIADSITEVTYKIRRAASIKSTTAKPFDYAEEVNKLSGEILTLKQLRKWWNKTLKELEARVHEDPTAIT